MIAIVCGAASSCTFHAQNTSRPVLPGSSASAHPGGFTQPVQVAHRWDAEGALILVTESPHSLSILLRAVRPIVSRFPVLQRFYHAYIRALIEDGPLGDNIVQMRIQVQCRLVSLSDMQRNFRIVVLACLPLRSLQQARADPLAAPICEHGERIDIPFILLRLPFEPASHSGIELCLVSTAQTPNQTDYL